MGSEKSGRSTASAFGAVVLVGVCFSVIGFSGVAFLVIGLAALVVGEVVAGVFVVFLFFLACFPPPVALVGVVVPVCVSATVVFTTLVSLVFGRTLVLPTFLAWADVGTASSNTIDRTDHFDLNVGTSITDPIDT